MAYTGFAKLKAKLAKRPGVTNPGALAASIGRKKFGAKKFNKAAATGTKLNHAKALSSAIGSARMKKS